jgi:hypothetical protein
MHPIWAERFPDWTAVVREPIWWADADATFYRAVHHSGRDLLIHLSVAFTPKWPGAFTADVVVSPAGEPLPFSPTSRWGDHGYHPGVVTRRDLRK